MAKVTGLDNQLGIQWTYDFGNPIDRVFSNGSYIYVVGPYGGDLSVLTVLNFDGSVESTNYYPTITQIACSSTAVVFFSPLDYNLYSVSDVAGETWTTNLDGWAFEDIVIDGNGLIYLLTGPYVFKVNRTGEYVGYFEIPTWANALNEVKEMIHGKTGLYCFYNNAGGTQLIAKLT